jgi:hypothetical protein
VSSWFKQRQGKLDPAGDDTYRLTAPNLGEAYIQVRREGERWSAHLLRNPAEPPLASTPPIYDTLLDAWGAAFELHRVHLVV